MQTKIQGRFPSEQDVHRCIDRLNESVGHRRIEEVLSAACFTNTLMNNYLRNENNEFKKNYYLLLYTQVIDKFQLSVSTEALSKLSANRLRILQDQRVSFERLRKQSQRHELNRQSIDQKYLEEFNTHFQNIERYYSEHNLDTAVKEISKLYSLKKQVGGLRVTVSMKEKMDKIERQYQKMLRFYGHLVDDEDWIFDKEENGIRMEYKTYEAQRTIGVRMEAVIDIQMMPFLAIASEIDFQTQYVPFVYVSEEIKSLARNRKAGYSLTYIPLLNDRECYFTAVGYDRMQTTGSLFLFTETYDENIEFQKEHDLHVPLGEDSEYVRLKVHYFCIDYKPLSKNRAQVRLVTKADLKLNFLPMFILQKSARTFTFNYFEKIVQKAKSFKGSIWEQRVKERPQLYNFFQSKIHEYFV